MPRRKPKKSQRRKRFIPKVDLRGPRLMRGARILQGLKDAVAGNFTRVTIEGQTWERTK